MLSLNCRGLGQLEAVQEIQSLIQMHCPLVVFLSETRVFIICVENLRRNFGFPNGAGVAVLVALVAEGGWHSSGQIRSLLSCKRTTNNI